MTDAPGTYSITSLQSMARTIHAWIAAAERAREATGCEARRAELNARIDALETLADAFSEALDTLDAT